jgi:hypothetical protein
VSQTFTAYPSGGVSPYTYEWGDAFASPSGSGQSVTFSVNLYNGQTYNASPWCIIRDSAGQSHTVYFSIQFVSILSNPLSVSLSPNPAFGYHSSGTFDPQNVNRTVTATPSGGTPGYSYVWQHISGDLFSIFNGNSATVTFSVIMYPGIRSGVYRCTVTDAASNVTYQDVTVTMQFDFNL